MVTRRIILIGLGLCVSSCATPGGGCQESYVYFTGYQRSTAAIALNGREIWSGQLNDRDPHNEISSIEEICLTSGSTYQIMDRDGVKEFTTPLSAGPFYIVVSSKLLGWPISVDTVPPILD